MNDFHTYVNLIQIVLVIKRFSLNNVEIMNIYNMKIQDNKIEVLYKDFHSFS